MKTTQTQVEPQELAGIVYQACEKYVETVESRVKSEDSKPYIPANVWAGQFSNCARQLTLRMTKSHELPPFKPEQLARFRRGKDRARNVKSDLEQAGRNARPPFELIGAESRFELVWNGLTVITGKVDWKTKFAIEGLPPVPTEYKSWSTMLTDRVNSFEDLFENRWTRKGAYQLLCYMWGSSSEFGLMVLDRPGLPKILPVSLFANENANLARVEKFLDLASLAVDCKNAGMLPDYIKDSAECKTCDFLGSHCTPPMLAGNGLHFIPDQELATALDRRGELQPAAKEFEHLDKEVKERLRGVELAAVGNWLIDGKFGKNTKTVVPPEHQALFDSWKKTDPKGKFTLKFFNLGAKADKEGEGDD